MKAFEINGKKYTAKPFDFNLICDLEDMGVSLQDASSKSMSMVRAYFALCTGMDKEFAGKEMEQHIIGGGKFDEIITAMSEEMEGSDFFRALNETAETENATSEKKETKKK